jgi:hypothetical protein
MTHHIGHLPTTPFDDNSYIGRIFFFDLGCQSARQQVENLQMTHH